MLLTLAVGITLSQARLATYVPPRPILTEAEDQAIRRRAVMWLKTYTREDCTPKDFHSSISKRDKFYYFKDYTFSVERDGTMKSFYDRKRHRMRPTSSAKRLTRTAAIHRALAVAKITSRRKHLVYKVYDVNDQLRTARITIEDTKTPWTCTVGLRQSDGVVFQVHAFAKWLRPKPGSNNGPTRPGRPGGDDFRSNG